MVFLQQAFSFLVKNASTILRAILISILAAYASAFYLRFTKRVRAPRIGKNPWLSGLSRARADFVKNGKRLTFEGYVRYKSSMYWIQTGDMERLVLPNRYIDELRRLPDSTIDSRQAVVERNLGWFNGVDIILKSTAHVDVCRVQLVQNLGKVVAHQVAGLNDILRIELSECFQNDRSDKYHFYNASETILNIINRNTAKILIGDVLCTDERWLSTSLQTTVYTGLLVLALQKYPSILRPIVYPFLSASRKLKESFASAQELLIPIMKLRVHGSKEHADILQWLIDSYKCQKLDFEFLTRQILFVAIAATRSTAASLVNTLYDMIEHCQFQQDLRDEVTECVAAKGWTLAAIHDMKKLDSFIKESQRLNHHLLLSFNRKVKRSVTLNDGLTLPAGTFISCPAYWTARDSEIFDDGNCFKPWRWYELVKEAEYQGESVTQYLCSSTSAENLHWGYGRSACPGRFMATVEIKLILAWLLHHFELTFPPGQSKRPESEFVDERVIPCRAQQIGFRPR